MLRLVKCFENPSCKFLLYAAKSPLLPSILFFRWSWRSNCKCGGREREREREREERKRGER